MVTVALYVAGRVTGAPIDPAPPADPYLRRSDLEQHDQNPGAHDGVAGLAADALPRTGGGVVAGPVVASSSTTRGHLTARRGSAELHVTVQPGGVGAIYHGTNPVLRFLAGVLYSLWPVSLPAGEPGPSHAVRRDWVDGQLAGHDADADAHPPLQARIVALENAEVDLDGHNADPDAHPPLRAAIGAAQTSADDAHDLADAAVTQAGAAAQRADDAYELAGDADSAAQTAAGTATDAAATAQAAQWRADEAYDLADGLSGSLSAHDDDADAHAPLRGRLDALESVAVPDPAGVPDGYVLAVWGGQLVWAPPGEGGPGDAPPVN